MNLPKFKKRSVLCGSVTTAVVTLLVSGDFLPAGWQNPVSMAALSGLLATFSAAFGLCEQAAPAAAADHDQERKPQ